MRDFFARSLCVFSSSGQEECESSSNQPLLLDRRTLLLGLGGLGAAALLPSCGSGSGGGSTAPPPHTLDAFHSLRALLRASPDHLSARAAAIVAGKDFTAAVQFVRDNIAVLPPPDSFGEATSAVRWGADATLRAGAGTQRERADLLAAMLTAMGAKATVGYADRPASVDLKALYATRTPTFSVDLSKLGGVDTATRAKLEAVPKTDSDPDPSSVIASLRALLPAGMAVASSPSDGLDDTVPVVAYSDRGVQKWAFALGSVDEVTKQPSGFGSSLPAVTYPTVAVRLLAAFGDLPGVATPTSLVELVSGTWTADQLAGSRMFVTTMPPDPQAAAGVPLDQLPLRVPVMGAVQPPAITDKDSAIWTPKATTSPKGVGGSAFTVSGAQFATPKKPGNPLVGPYGELLDLDKSAHAAALARVASLEAQATGGAFPDIQLTFAARDASGAPIFGLLQTDFTVTDEMKAEAPVLLSNGGIDIKIMLAYDCSSSVTWPAGQKTVFDNALANAFVASAASTSFEVGYADVGDAPSAFAAPKAASLLTDIDGCFSGSNVWQTLGEIAPSAGIAAVVIVSDFVSTDDPTTIPALQQRLAASAISVALVPVSTDVDQKTVNAIVETCGATVLDWTAADFQKKLTAFVTATADHANASGYRSTYTLPKDQQTNQGTRTVEVALASKASVSTSSKYTVPPASARGSLGIAGLYLELTLGSGQPVRRRLSGPLLDDAGNPSNAPTQADFAMTRALLDGRTTVVFEPGSPTGAVNADDLLSCAMSMTPLLDAKGKSFPDALGAVSPMRQYSGAAAALVDPVSSPAGTDAVAPRLRVVLMTELVSAGIFQRRFDIVPECNLTVAADSDASRAFAATMRATVPLSLREGNILLDSAAKSLAGAKLQYLAPYTTSSGLTGFDAADQATWASVFAEYSSWHRFVPTTPKTGAMWVVDPGTGTTVAVYVNGSGGSCLGQSINAGIQEAVALIGLAGAMRWYSCEALEDPYPCLGWTIAVVNLGAAALIPAGLADAITLTDMILLVLGSTLGALHAGLGLVVALDAAAVTTAEGYEAVVESCFGD
jgi:hypothetical protein